MTSPVQKGEVWLMLDLIKKYLLEGFIYAVAASPLKKTDEETLARYGLTDCSKVKVKPVMLKERKVYQVTRTVGPKELHENMDAEAVANLLSAIAGNPFKNIEVVNGADKLSLLANKKGEVTVKEHKGAQKKNGTDLEKKGNSGSDEE